MGTNNQLLYYQYSASAKQTTYFNVWRIYKSGSGSGKSKEDRIQWLDEKNKTTSNDPQKTTQKMEEQEPTGNRGDL